MREPEWIDSDVVRAIHEALLAEHGGLPGIRDEGLLESGLARPKNLFTYSSKVSLRQLAAAYVGGIARNHPFVDGNKRTAWVVCALFLELNGITVVAEQADVVRVMIGVAKKSINEEKVVWWLEQTTVTA